MTDPKLKTSNYEVWITAGGYTSCINAKDLDAVKETIDAIHTAKEDDVLVWKTTRGGYVAFVKKHIAAYEVKVDFADGKTRDKLEAYMFNKEEQTDPQEA